MKKQIALLTVSAIAVSAFGATFVHANETTAPAYGKQYKQEMKGMQSKMKDMRMDMKDNRQTFHEDNGNVMQFFGTGITEETKTLIKTHMDAFQSAMKTLEDSERAEVKAIAQSGSTDTASGVSTEVKAIHDAYITKRVEAFKIHMTELKAYVDPTKVAEFEAFVAKRAELFKQNSDIRGNMKEMNGDMKTMHKDMMEKRKDLMQDRKESKLPIATKKLLDTKLDSIAVDKKEAIFTLVISRIDAIITKTTDAKKKSLYTAVRDYVQSKLDEIQSDGELDSVLNNL